MTLRSTSDHFGAIAKFFHWTNAALFIGAYVVVYYVIWFMDDSSPEALPFLNIHWVLGLLVGALVLPRIIWRLVDDHPVEVAISPVEHRLAQAAHLALYALLIVMPLTGYLGTGAPVNFGLFETPSFKDTDLFHFLSRTFQMSWEAFEEPIDVIHHFVGKWIAWGVVALHIAAALFHHVVRRDEVLLRMLPLGRPDRQTRRA